jgi:hypothetical protein
VTAVPLELLALAYARRQGATMLGFDDTNRRDVNWRQIFGSAIPGSESVSGAGGDGAEATSGPAPAGSSRTGITE